MYNNIFVLSTGRCGSLTFFYACKHIHNYTSFHESANQRKKHSLIPYKERFPKKHVEIDNRLSWFLGMLASEYGEDAYYVHLVRDRISTAKSLARRRGIFQTFSTAMMHRPLTDFANYSPEEKIEIALYYCDTVNSNIELFLNNMPNKLTIHIEDPIESFTKFWREIKAEGELGRALDEFGKHYHAS